jgi:multidrug transporter EmrE-like cation transporter
MNRAFDHVYIFSMIVFTIYSQIIMRWRVGLVGHLPESALGKVAFIAGLLTNPWVLSGIFATFLAGVSWMLALSKFELSYAYPYTGLIYVFMMMAGAFVFGDAMTPGRVVGTLITIAGLIVISRG